MRAGLLLAALYEFPLFAQGVPALDPPALVEDDSFLSIANSPRFSREFSVRPDSQEYVLAGDRFYKAYRLDPCVPDETHLKENLTWLVMGDGGVVQDPEEYVRAAFAANWQDERADLARLLKDQSLQLAQLEKDTATPDLLLAVAPFVSSQLYGVIGLSPFKGLPSLPEAAQDVVTSAILGEMDHQIRLAHGAGLDSAQAFRGAMRALLHKNQEELAAIAQDAAAAKTYEEMVPLANRVVQAETTRHAALTALASYFNDPTPWNFLVEQVVAPAVGGVSGVDLEPWLRQWGPALHTYFADATQAAALYRQKYAPESVQPGADRVLGTLKRVHQDTELQRALEETGIPHLEEDYRSYRRNALSPNATADDRVAYLLFLAALPHAPSGAPDAQARARERYATMSLKDVVRQVDAAFQDMLLHPDRSSPQVTVLQEMMDVAMTAPLPQVPLPTGTQYNMHDAVAVYRSSIALADQLLRTVEQQHLPPEKEAHFRALRQTYRSLEQYQDRLPRLDVKYQQQLPFLLR